MPKIVVYLDNVYCYDTEDVTGADELYVVGAVKTADGSTSAGFVTQPISINDDQIKNFGPGAGYVFEQDLPSGSRFQIEMTAFDEDAAKSADDYVQAKELINQALAAVPDPRVSLIGQLTVEAADTIVRLDKDDQLSTILKPFDVNQLKDGWSLHKWEFREDGIGWSTWRYDISYWIGKF